MQRSSILAAMIGLGASLAAHEVPAMLAALPSRQPTVNRRPAGAHKAFVRAAGKARRVRAHRARA